jgi:hypothetical protein|tara:strand:+ start:71 stop:178 length:108 start_codon:yes stop_codon:yes gene_type:complete
MSIKIFGIPVDGEEAAVEDKAAPKKAATIKKSNKD